jgi:hypothetical protein
VRPLIVCRANFFPKNSQKKRGGEAGRAGTFLVQHFEENGKPCMVLSEIDLAHFVRRQKGQTLTLRHAILALPSDYYMSNFMAAVSSI